MQKGVIGSSPHSRGTHICLECLKERERIIPALAGNTIKPVRGFLVSRDHPRTRGEHHQKQNPWTDPLGSSPHSRGTRTRGLIHHSHIGIIPALAGNTGYNPFIIYVIKDHPRTRGEHSRTRLLETERWGSSPHSRGTQSFHHDILGHDGIIPALAGNTLKSHYYLPVLVIVSSLFL